MAFMARGASVAAMAAPDGPEQASGAAALGSMRRDYDVGSLEEEGLAATWLDQMRAWLDDAMRPGCRSRTRWCWPPRTDRSAERPHRPAQGRSTSAAWPSSPTCARAKGRSWPTNPRASAVFPWHPIQRQVVVAGAVEPVATGEADDYFASRPLGSRLAALASPQSDLVESRGALEAASHERRPAGRRRSAAPGVVGRAADRAGDASSSGRGAPTASTTASGSGRRRAGWVVERLAP